MQPTDQQIRQLEVEAGAAGDHEMVVICRRALCGDADAVTEVANVIREAAGNDG